MRHPSLGWRIFFNCDRYRNRLFRCFLIIEPEVILIAVGWYLRFSPSYRDVEELLAERGLLGDHVTVWRRGQRYAPEMERRLRSRLKPTADSWRVDFDLHPGQGHVALPVSCGGVFRRDPRLSPGVWGATEQKTGLSTGCRQPLDRRDVNIERLGAVP